MARKARAAQLRLRNFSVQEEKNRNDRRVLLIAFFNNSAGAFETIRPVGKTTEPF
jgi:hypothetical protein